MNDRLQQRARVKMIKGSVKQAIGKIAGDDQVQAQGKADIAAGEQALAADRPEPQAPKSHSGVRATR